MVMVVCVELPACGQADTPWDVWCLRHAGALAWRRGPVCACTRVCWCRRIFTLQTYHTHAHMMTHIIYYIYKLLVVGGWGFPVGCFPPCGVFPPRCLGAAPLRFFCCAWLLPFCDVCCLLCRPGVWPTARPPAWQRLAWSCCCRPAQHAPRPRTSHTSW